MTVSPRPQSAAEDLHSFGEQLKGIALRFKEELAIRRIALRFELPIEALDIPKAVLEAWVDGNEDKAFATADRLNEEARALEQRKGLPWRSAVIIPHWLT